MRSFYLILAKKSFKCDAGGDATDKRMYVKSYENRRRDDAFADIPMTHGHDTCETDYTRRVEEVVSW